MKKYKLLKLLSLLLATTMLIAGFPIAAVAENIDNAASTVVDDESLIYENINDTELDETQTDVYILAEDTTKRGEFEKHYLCSDGTFVAVTYAEAVHYRDDNNEWIDIDNSLSVNETNGTYEAQNGNYKISFYTAAPTQGNVSVASTQSNAKGISTVSASKLITMQNGNSTLSWTLTANKKLQSSIEMGDYTLSENSEQTALSVSSSASLSVLGRMKNETENNSFTKINVNDESAFSLPKVSNTVIYNSLFGENEGISVRYTAYRNKIEEDIFIERKTDIESFSMSVDCEDLVPVLNPDNSIDFIDKNGEMAYHISIPYMIDAAYAVLNDIQVTLSVQEDKCIITYTPDGEWLSSPDRVYPIMLDPSVTTKEYQSNVEDTYIKNGDTANHSDEQNLSISFGDMPVIAFDSLPVIHDSLPIQKATLNLTLLFAQFNETPINLEVRTTGIAIDEITYDEYSDSILEYTNSSYMFPSQTAIAFDWTQDFHDIYTYIDDMIFVVKLNESNANYSYNPICSSENTNGAGPYITITYGYAFSDEFNTGDLLSFQNVDNERYIDYGAVQNSTAQTTSSSVNFRLVKNQDTGGYKIQSTANSSLYLTISSNTFGLIWSSDNIPERQEWLFVPAGNATFYIVSRGDMNMALTMTDQGHYENGEWVVTGGYLYCYPIELYDCAHCNGDHQQWFLYENGVMLVLDGGTTNIDTGVYYINNVGYGGFLTKSRTIAKGFSWELGNNIEWVITNLGNNQYTIQTYNDVRFFLSCTSTGAITLVRRDVSLTDDCIWTISMLHMFEPGVLTIQNKATGFYLYFNGVSLATCLSTTTTDNGYKWRMVREDLYIDPTVARVSFADLTIPVGSSSYVSITASSGTSFVSRLYDFEYTVISGAANVSVTNKGVVSGLQVGDATLKATHKTTGANFSFNVRVIGPAEGVYFFKNKQTEKYMQLDDNGENFMEQQPFSGEEDQMWELIYYGDGYYKIMNKATSLYLTAPNNANEGESIIQASWQTTTASRQLWSFTELSDGVYKIQAESHAGTNLCLSTGESSSGANTTASKIYQKTYTNDSNYADEWLVKENCVYIEFSFDQKFVEWHRIETETFEETAERLSNTILNEVFPIVATAYFELCGIKLKTIQKQIPNYISDADACLNKDADGHCTCISNSDCVLEFTDSPLKNNNVYGFEKESHCDSAIRLRNNLITNIPGNTIRISFTGHSMCFTGDHNYPTLSGLSDYTHPIIIINEKLTDISTGLIRKEFALLMTHEISHLYGINLHHDALPEVTCVVPGRTYYSQIDINDYRQFLCSDCINIIKQNRFKWWEL